MSDAPIDPRLIMHAALDGELDAAGQIAFERALAGDPVLTKEYERLVALRGALRGNFPRGEVPAALAARLREQAGPQIPVHHQVGPARRAAFSLAASVLLGVGIGGGATYWAVGRGQADLTGALIAGHRRALLAGAPVDIVSRDRHAVRPWFDARIAVSPPAPDLTASGFPLVGGRVDVVGGAPVPALVYRIHEHLVSVTALPATAAAAKGAAPSDGYHVLSWRGPGFTYWAVTDADPPELENFAAAFRATVENAREIPSPR